jgi:Uma2 family endonuclease
MVEIMLPETKPAMEWVNGRALQKVSPQRKHALAQGTFFIALYGWAMREGSGRVGTEWEFRIAPPGEIRRPLVPDVAYLSYDRVPYESAAQADIPRVAPDVVVEILSPGDRPADVEEKLRAYLAAGSAVVFLVDTAAQTVTARAVSGQRIFSAQENLTDSMLPGFSMPVRGLFTEPRPKQRAAR